MNCVYVHPQIQKMFCHFNHLCDNHELCGHGSSSDLVVKWFSTRSTLIIFVAFMNVVDVRPQSTSFRKWFATRFTFVSFATIITFVNMLLEMFCISFFDKKFTFVFLVAFILYGFASSNFLHWKIIFQKITFIFCCFCELCGLKFPIRHHLTPFNTIWHHTCGVKTPNNTIQHQYVFSNFCKKWWFFKKNAKNWWVFKFLRKKNIFFQICVKVDYFSNFCKKIFTCQNSSKNDDFSNFDHNWSLFKVQRKNASI